MSEFRRFRILATRLALACNSGARIRVLGLGFRVRGLGLRVGALGLRVQVQEWSGVERSGAEWSGLEAKAQHTTGNNHDVTEPLPCPPPPKVLPDA